MVEERAKTVRSSRIFKDWCTCRVGPPPSETRVLPNFGGWRPNLRFPCSGLLIEPLRVRICPEFPPSTEARKLGYCDEEMRASRKAWKCLFFCLGHFCASFPAKPNLTFPCWPPQTSPIPILWLNQVKRPRLWKEGHKRMRFLVVVVKWPFFP